MLAGIHSATFLKMDICVPDAGVAARRAARRQAGFTLVELLVALGLFGFVLLAITPLFMASVRSNFSGNEYTSIHVLARDRLEQLMNLPFNDPQLSPGTHDVVLPPVLPNGAPNPFRLRYEVLQFQIPASENVQTNQSFVPTPVTRPEQSVQYKRIDVTVSSGSGPIGIGARTARVSGCLSNPFPQLPAPTPVPTP
jgi:prepilin-type N-terminal cleavage/methylation domain-containing protein